MIFDKLAYADFFSGLGLRVWTDSEFWQNLGSFADIKISLTKAEIVLWCEIRASPSPERAQTINDFDPI